MGARVGINIMVKSTKLSGERKVEFFSHLSLLPVTTPKTRGTCESIYLCAGPTLQSLVYCFFYGSHST